MEQETRRQYACVVDDDEVARFQQSGEVAHVTVLGRLEGTAIDEQAGAVTWLQRVLGDAIGRQRVVELRHLHRAPRYRGLSTYSAPP
jgi:hypothetical protein